ncbi:T9SS type A sorting domain-containing protein [Roseivirga sp. E12]|uniref:T9SS type A sorting domain-containing protein n=1 Tax=Roseivirga sp. E12 TaxID=2819237 RepID=UPI001ABC9514|nr:T9SS type A sorting domain-containing protein [Roseivirga sp. E12]MBO3699477.1 T9SS type A sorting domain-containing protein [Roseivirga sp. E12]
MKRHLLIAFLALISFDYAHSQTIHMSGYHNGPYLEYCPNTETEMTFFARDIFQNKIHGNLQYFFFVDGVSRNDIAIEFDNDPLGPTYGPFLTLHTDSNKESKFRIRRFIGNNAQGVPQWVDGFGFQSNNIVLEVRFKGNGPFASWKTRTFNFRTRAIPPGKAVVVGTNDLLFCSPGEIKNITLPNFPVGATNAAYCNWHHGWTWELPAGWKVTSTTGDLSTATNTYTTHSETVKVQAPSGLLLPGTLNVRSEDAWPYPVNTQTQINVGSPNVPANLSYNFLVDFPASICYDNSGNNLATFIAETPFFGSLPTSYEWQSNAGNVLSSTTTNPTTTIQFNNPGTGRYVRVRAVNACGTSPWLTKYFDLTYDPWGCSGGGLGGGIGFGIDTDLNVYPNPAIDQVQIEIDEPESLIKELESKQIEMRYSYTLINNDQRIVHSKITNSPKYKLPLDQLPDGIYILRVVSPAGTKTERILVDKSKR